MSGDWTDEKFANKIDSEGGVMDALDYGLRSRMLGNKDGALFRAWHALEVAWEGGFEDLVAAVDEATWGVLE